jgi:hypothetical protein
MTVERSQLILTNTRLASKKFPINNALAYFAASSVTTKKKLMTSAPDRHRPGQARRRGDARVRNDHQPRLLLPVASLHRDLPPHTARNGPGRSAPNSYRAWAVRVAGLVPGRNARWVTFGTIARPNPVAVDVGGRGFALEFSFSSANPRKR